MKYAIFGDIHSNLEALTAVLEKAEQEEVDKYICTGDIVGYNADPFECLNKIRELQPDVIVRGNHDDYIGSEIDLLGFNPQAAHVVEWTREHLNPEDRQWLAELPLSKTVNHNTTIVHATLDMPGRWGYIFDKFNAMSSFNYQYTPICFFGHTHIPSKFEKFGGVNGDGGFEEIILQPGHKYMINPGSAGQPRDGDSRAAMAIYDTEEKLITLHRVEYDIETAQKKIRNSSLPERCAERLALGR